MMIGGVSSADDAVVAVDDLGDAHAGHGGRVAAQIFDVRVHAWPGGSDHAAPEALVAVDPVLPAERRQPKPVDQDDGVGGVGGIGGVGGHGVLLTSRNYVEDGY
jgi:hypothetical protein